jgi:apolipoprotein N-acyltransferase
MKSKHLLLALSTSVGLVLSFPAAFTDGIASVAWLALAPFIYLISTNLELSFKRILFWSVLIGLLFFYGSYSWLGYSIIHYGGLPPALVYALFLIPGVVMGLFFTLFAVLLRRAVTRWGNIGVLAAAPIWVVTEWLRLKLIGHGWNSLGYSQAFHPSLIQFARVAGVYGVSFLLVMTSAVVVYLILEFTRESAPIRNRRASVLLAVAIVAVTLALALFPFGPREGSQDGKPLTVIAIQPVIPFPEAGSGAGPPDVGESFRRHLFMSERALREVEGREEAKLVIWPESPMNISLDEDLEVARILGDFAAAYRVYVLVNHLGKVTGGGYHNSAAIISPEGKRIADYNKTHLLVFGEYVPMKEVLPFAEKLQGIAGDFIPGSEFTVVPIGGAQVGPFICFESAFPEIPRELARRGATLLVNISNDNWFGTTAGARQHLMHAIFRAVETARPMVRVTNSGISALISARGEVKATTNLFERTARTWTIERAGESQPPQLTLYSRYGDVFVLFCSILSLLVVFRRARISK